MSTIPQQPQRKLTLGLKIGADSAEELRIALRQIADDLTGYDGESPASVWSGGYGNGYTMVVVVKPGQSHEQYVADLTAWLEANDGPRI